MSSPYPRHALPTNGLVMRRMETCITYPLLHNGVMGLELVGQRSSLDSIIFPH